MNRDEVRAMLQQGGARKAAPLPPAGQAPFAAGSEAVPPARPAPVPQEEMSVPSRPAPVPQQQQHQHSQTGNDAALPSRPAPLPQQQQPRAAAPLPPQQQQQQQPQPTDQRTFEVANASEASIVKPILPHNVLDQMQNRLKGQGGGAPAEEPPQAQAPPPQPRKEEPLRAAPPPPTLLQPPSEQKQLVDTMEAHLRERGGLGVTLTVGELSGQMRMLTGFSWGGHWEAKFGALMPFLKQHPGNFTVVQNKYVVAKGMEELAQRQLERDAQANSALLEEQNRSRALNSSMPMMNMLGSAPPQLSGFNDPSLLMPNTSYYEEPWGGQQQPPAADGGGGYFYDDDPSRRLSRVDSGEWMIPMGTSSATAAAGYNAYDSTQLPVPPAMGGMDPFAPVGGYGDSFGEAWMNPNPDAWADSAWDAFPPPAAAAAASAPSSFLPNNTLVAGDDWWNQPAPVPVAVASPVKPAKPSKAQQEEEAAARRAAAKKQQEEDEALARKLQEAEFRSNGVAAASEWIVLTTAEMRELAEKEIGKDNVRIIAGFTVKKFGREGRPHQRKMWVTQSLTHLAWASSLLEGSHRGIELKHVTAVVPGQMTATIARATSDREKVRAFCLSLVTQSRTLDMQACSVVQRNALVDALTAVVAFNKKYRPERVDRDLTRVQLTGFATLFKPTVGSTGVMSRKSKGG